MLDDLAPILAKHRQDPTRLVQILRDVMAARGVITPPDITQLAQALGLPRGRVEGVAGFYAFFVTETRGPGARTVGDLQPRYRVLFSDNVTDEMAGGTVLRQRMLDAFGVELGEVSRDGMVRIGTTSCTGLCDQGPALLVNGVPIARLTPARIGAITALLRSGAPIETWPENLFPIHTHVARKDLLLGTPLGPGDGLAAAVARGAQATLDEVRTSGLRGRGGAGFATATKWEACRVATGRARYVVCNADEGEPGTFKDRVLLGDWAELVIEGMTVAAYLIRGESDTQHGLFYLRAEYPFLVPHLEAILARRRAAGLLGGDVGGVTGFHFDIELHVGAGAYVCGEESALIESLEGKRGIPRNRPPYPVTHGYLQEPTVVNNVETLAAAALIAKHGGGWWRQRGTAKSAGTKVLSVSGDVATPGIYEFPFGVTIQAVLEAAGAAGTQAVQAVQVGGPSGMLVAPHEFGRKIAFEDVPSAGAFMVFDASRDMLAVVRNFARFFADESCGFCTPCRVGTTLVAQMMDRMVAGAGTRRDLKDLTRVAKLMKATSHCGLGTTAGNPVLDALEKFRPAFERQVVLHEVLPMFDLDAALAPAREITGRDDAEAHLGQGGQEGQGGDGA